MLILSLMSLTVPHELADTSYVGSLILTPIRTVITYLKLLVGHSLRRTKENHE